MMDFLPTCAVLAGASLPPGHIIDGQDLRPLITGAPGATSRYDEAGFFYYMMDQLQAVRSGPWKLYLPLDNKIVGLGRKTAPSRTELFDVRNDLGETTEVSAQHPEVVTRLLALADTAREDLGDLDRDGRNQRPAGWVADPKPQVLPQ
jgi:arylsulfatase A-like enzyme